MAAGLPVPLSVQEEVAAPCFTFVFGSFRQRGPPGPDAADGITPDHEKFTRSVAPTRGVVRKEGAAARRRQTGSILSRSSPTEQSRFTRLMGSPKAIPINRDLLWGVGDRAR